MHPLLSYTLLPLTTFSTCINTSCTTSVLTYFPGAILASLGPSTSLLFMLPSSPSLFHYGNTFFTSLFVLGGPQWRLLLFKAVFTPPLFLPESTLFSGSPGLESSFRPSAPSSTSSFIIKNYPSLYFHLQDLYFYGISSHQFQEIISSTNQPFTPESTSSVYEYLGTLSLVLSTHLLFTYHLG